MSRLKTLNLANNKIEDWDNLPLKLEGLHFEKNLLTEISPVVANLKKLTFLDLSFNQIVSIKFLDKINSLQILILKHNQIDSIKILSGLKNLQEIDCESNDIRDLSDLKAFQTCRMLKFLSVADNPVVK